MDRIVGVSEYTDEPSILKRKPKVGGYNRVQIESVMALKPDLVLATQDGNSKDQIDHLRERKIPVVVVRSESLDDLFKSVEWVSKSMGLEEAGKRLENRLKHGLEKIKARAEKRKAKGLAAPKVLLQVGAEPFVVAGSRSFLTAALEWVGAVNIYGDSKDHYPRPSLEDAVSRNPDFILIMSLGVPNEDIARAKREWLRFKAMPVVKKERVKILRADALLRPTGRFLEGISILESSLYGKP
jgi:iron complex transport system substrate-binding protein